MVFQNYALYPHMTVRQNMGFALKLEGTPRAEIERKVEAAAKILDINRHLDRKPANLSGGQRQRVAMGRAIVRDPEAFLMDEPLWEAQVCDRDKPSLMEVTDPERDLVSCMRGYHGAAWYMLAWVGGLALPTMLVLALISIVTGR